MDLIKTTLSRSEKIAEGTRCFFLRKPEGFSFVAGQYAVLSLLDPPFEDKKGPNRSMSIASAPQEEFLAFAMRDSESAFKRSIAALKEGEEIGLRGPFGSFTLPEEKKTPVVFLVGGIGITPVRSIVISEKFQKSEREMVLIYSNRTLESSAFHEEFEKMSLPGFRYFNTITDEGACEGWGGEKGFVCPEMIARHISDIEKYLFYIVGPGGFVKAMQNMLLEMGVSKEKTIVDNFG